MRRLLRRLHGDDGSATAEYAVLMLAAVGFAGVMLKLLTSAHVQALLSGLIDRVL